MTIEPNYVYGHDRSVEAVKHIKTRVAMSKLYITINYFFNYLPEAVIHVEVLGLLLRT
jgi:hypothetical protein